MDASRPACPGLSEPLGDHPLAQCLGGMLVSVVGCQLLTGRRGAKVRIVSANQSQHLLAYGIGQGVSGGPTEAAREQSREAFCPVSGYQALDLPHAQAHLPSRIFLP